MKKILFLLLLPLIIFADTLTLEEEYTFETNTIYAKDLFPQIDEDFILITIPGHLQHFQVGKQRLIKELNAHGHTVTENLFGLVNFSKKMQIDTSEINEAIANYYQEKLPFLEIASIDVKIKSFQETLPKRFTLVFKEQAFKHANGSVKLESDTKRLFFEYEVHASYSQFQAKTSLKRHTPITLANTQMIMVDFDHYYEPLISFDALNYSQSKHYIKKGKAITQKDVERLDLVRKGAIVNVKLLEGNIALTFTATALQSGAKDEFISLKRDNGSILRGKVMAKDKVLVE